MGLALTKFALSKGNQVVATSRNIEAFNYSIDRNRENFLPLKVDITSDADVQDAVDRAIKRFGKLDVVVNNAGYSLVGSMEEISDHEFRRTMDVNLFGTVNVIRHTIGYLRKQQSGHMINIASNAGSAGFANAGSYNAAKFGVIGLSEALAQEVQPFGVSVTVVAPGQFRTHFMDEGSMVFAKKKIDVYGTGEAEIKWRNFSGRQIGDPEKLAGILYDITGMQNPPLHLLLGPDTYELVMAQREKERQEIENWKHLTFSTNFD
jgi:NAD(P)-dependent dehydrogenase (short-subunit alcohol dehydrogenase family)